MKRFSLLCFSIILSSALTACADRQWFWPVEDGKPAQGQGGQHGASASSRALLDVPPELRGEVQVPAPAEVATSGEKIPAADKKPVTGKSVALDAKVYVNTPAEVFSAAIDSMTALNMPVQSVDSPSGTLTTDWIRQQSVSSKAAAVVTNMFGAGGPQALRYRFVVRVLRQQTEGSEVTRLEIRTIGQVFVNRNWVNRPLQRKVSDELFAAVEERLSK